MIDTRIGFVPWAVVAVGGFLGAEGGLPLLRASSRPMHLAELRAIDKMNYGARRFSTCRYRLTEIDYER
jgi:hypothetical protein